MTLKQKAKDLFSLFNATNDFKILEVVGGDGFYVIDPDEPLVFEYDRDIPTILEWLGAYVKHNRKELEKFIDTPINCEVTQRRQINTLRFLTSFDELKKEHPFDDQVWERLIF